MLWRDRLIRGKEYGEDRGPRDLGERGPWSEVETAQGQKAGDRR